MTTISIVVTAVFLLVSGPLEHYRVIWNKQLDAVGYRVYYSPVEFKRSFNDNRQFDVGDVNQFDFADTDVTLVDKYITVTCYDTVGNESEFSNILNPVRPLVTTTSSIPNSTTTTICDTTTTSTIPSDLCIEGEIWEYRWFGTVLDTYYFFRGKIYREENLEWVELKGNYECQTSYFRSDKEVPARFGHMFSFFGEIYGISFEIGGYYIVEPTLWIPYFYIYDMIKIDEANGWIEAMYWFTKGRPGAPVIRTVDSIEIEKWRFDLYNQQVSLHKQ